ncbi:universal stress protein [Salarchaeum sp. JOR-1]|uniref:universal stress protein n=1 Tax=Salarchaeum sp. JOR-1 TaxID=2599399 RepID=UPI0011984464|nr:universal stress protein [Salarchaeum sp. JOR-1]QDX40214.1 universal stress protein [Salarchaeum sp. JOR-1]
MKILVPVDGSDISFRALSFGAEMARRYEGTVHVVHITDRHNDVTDEIVERAKDILDAEGIQDNPEVSLDLDLDFRPSKRVGEDVLTLVDERGYDHVVMGHHGSGTVERAILGSAAETVIKSDKVAVTVVP